MKYIFLLLMVYGMQAIRVADDVDHLQDSEKCRPCYHHRFLKTETPPGKYSSELDNTVTILV